MAGQFSVFFSENRRHACPKAFHTPADKATDNKIFKKYILSIHKIIMSLRNYPMQKKILLRQILFP